MDVSRLTEDARLLANFAFSIYEEDLSVPIMQEAFRLADLHPDKGESSHSKGDVTAEHLKKACAKYGIEIGLF